jgi:hypothetical protein
LDAEKMTKKESCINTDYTGGFKITVESDGTFTAVRGKNKISAISALEINKAIQKFNQENK